MSGKKLPDGHALGIGCLDFEEFQQAVAGRHPERLLCDSDDRTGDFARRFVHGNRVPNIPTRLAMERIGAWPRRQAPDTIGQHLRAHCPIEKPILFLEQRRHRSLRVVLLLRSKETGLELCDGLDQQPTAKFRQTRRQ